MILTEPPMEQSPAWVKRDSQLKFFSQEAELKRYLD